MDRTPTSLYKYYDSYGVLLYAGITSRRSTRNVEHGDKEWWPFVVRQEVEHLPDRPAALAAERAMIRMHRPPFNRQHNIDCESLRTAYLAFAAASPVEPSAENFIEQYRRLDHKLPLAVVRFNERTQVTTFATMPEHLPVSRTVVLVKRPFVVQDVERVGMVDDLARMGMHTYITARLRKTALPARAVAVLKTITLKEPIQTRIHSIRLLAEES